MKSYNIEIGEKLKLESLIYRVTAKNRKDANRKVKELGFNCGYRLSSTYSGEFKPRIFDEVKGDMK